MHYEIIHQLYSICCHAYSYVFGSYLDIQIYVQNLQIFQ